MTNISLDDPTPKRACAQRAAGQIKQQIFHHASKGSDKTDLLDPADEPGDKPLTMAWLVRNRPGVLEKGMQHIQQYIERNTSYEIQKASALNIFAGAVQSGHGIMEACDLSSLCTNFLLGQSGSGLQNFLETFSLSSQTLMTSQMRSWRRSYILPEGGILNECR